MKTIFSHNSKLVANSLLAAILLATTPVAHAARAKKKTTPTPPVVTEPASPYSVEIGVTVDGSANDLYTGQEIHRGKVYNYTAKVATIGADITGVYALDENRAITLRLGYNAGSVDDDVLDGARHDEWSVSRISFMPGFRYTKPWGAKTHYFIGANIGLVQQSVENKETYPGQPTDTYTGNSTGLGYSAEIGFTYKFSDNTTLLLAYQLSGSTNETSFGDDAEFKTKQQMYHSLRAGVNIKF